MPILLAYCRLCAVSRVSGASRPPSFESPIESVGSRPTSTLELEAPRAMLESRAPTAVTLTAVTSCGTATAGMTSRPARARAATGCDTPRHVRVFNQCKIRRDVSYLHDCL